MAGGGRANPWASAGTYNTPLVLTTDVLVVGGGHAGCEAAYAAVRLGLRALLVTLDLAGIARMSCNPSIGGPAKGHLTREIDALGGLQGAVTDATYVNLRMLNTGKGASVQALRAQSDRQAYSREMYHRLQAAPGLELLAGEVIEILTERPVGRARPRACGALLADGREIKAQRVIVCPGTFTRGRCFVGQEQSVGGRLGEPAADALGAGLTALGLTLHRLKTGTSPRVNRDSIDYTALSPQLSEWRSEGFEAYAPAMLPAWFLPCWLTRTTAQTRQLIMARQSESALLSGLIDGPGPRYCPSIEDKMHRFPTAQGHPVFVEPDGLDTDVVYLQGLATSLSRDAQRGFLDTIPGLERARIIKPGYAVEYDAINPLNLTAQLESKDIDHLHCAGQFNGTSGYEEAAAQGLVAGANAALSLLGREPLPLTRANSYTGVLIDDLTTRGTEEPYRMLTARAEHRLLLRHDNAALRLGPIARDWGLLTVAQCRALETLSSRVHAVEAKLEGRKISIGQQRRLGVNDRRPRGMKGAELVRRGIPAEAVLAESEAGADYGVVGDEGHLLGCALRHVEIELRYAGYLERARAETDRVARQGGLPIPDGFDFSGVRSILKATREQLARVRPLTLGQAARVPGVTPADVANLLVELRRRGGVS